MGRLFSSFQSLKNDQTVCSSPFIYLPMGKWQWCLLVKKFRETQMGLWLSQIQKKPSSGNIRIGLSDTQST